MKSHHLEKESKQLTLIQKKIKESSFITKYGLIQSQVSFEVLEFFIFYSTSNPA